MAPLGRDSRTSRKVSEGDGAALFTGPNLSLSGAQASVQVRKLPYPPKVQASHGWEHRPGVAGPERTGLGTVSAGETRCIALVWLVLNGLDSAQRQREKLDAWSPSSSFLPPLSDLSDPTAFLASFTS